MSIFKIALNRQLKTPLLLPTRHRKRVFTESFSEVLVQVSAVVVTIVVQVQFRDETGQSTEMHQGVQRQLSSFVDTWLDGELFSAEFLP